MNSNIKKSLKDISWLVDEPTYRADSAYSYSTISRYGREGFEKLSSLFDEQKSEALTFGSIVDCLLLGDEGDFDKKFYVGDFPEIPQDFIPVLYAINEETNYTSLAQMSDDDIVSYLDRFNIYTSTNWKPATKAPKLRMYDSYYSILRNAGEKEVISNKMFNDATNCVRAFKTSETTERFFIPDNQWDGIERLHQLKFKGEYNGTPIRGMLDLTIVDHTNKTIFPKDVKTTGAPEYKFYKSYVKWDYANQANMYDELLRQNIAKDAYFKDFVIMPFEFLVVNKDSLRPKRWAVDLYMQQSTVNYNIGDIEFVNWRELLCELKYYIECAPSSPIGINETGQNSLSDWIKTIK